MAKPREPKKAPSMLPLPAAIVAHHDQVLAGPKREWMSREQAPPVLLLTGLEGVGKRSIAHHLSQWMLCERNGFGLREAGDSTGDLFGGPLVGGPAAKAERPSDRPLEPCGECASCQRALHGSWVDFTEILPDDDEEGKGTLKVEQFREIRSKMGFGSHEGAVRITLIPNADRMTAQAANSMLKLLEEPPKGWVFFLTASDPTLVLPTILSRCQALRLRPLATQSILKLLEEGGVPAERRAVAAELAQGSWGKALEISVDEQWDRRAAIFRFLQDPAANLGELVEWASQTPRQLDLLLAHLEHALSDLVIWSASGQSPTQHVWKSRDGATALAAHAAQLGRTRGADGARHFWTERATRLGEIRRQSQAPLNRKILVQDLLMPWLAS